MRVISGTAKGRVLLGPKSPRIRPVLDKIKGAIFNILGDIQGTKALDLFAGTGAVGIEALSRGAAFCVFVDFSSEALGLMQKNLQQLGMRETSKIVRFRLPARSGLKSLVNRFNEFDLVFVDPPYDQNLVNPSLRALADEKILAAGGTVVVEHSPREKIAETVGLTVTDQRKYGQTFISFLTHS